MEQLYLIVILLMFVPSILAILGIIFMLLDDPITRMINWIAIRLNQIIKKLK